MRLISIGADPELFVKNYRGVSSVIGKLGGSKNEPKMVDGYGIQEDNVLAEFAMPPVHVLGALAESSFSHTVQLGIQKVSDMLDKRGLYPVDICSHKYRLSQLRNYGPKALEFGCDPDKNAYTGDENPAPNSSSTLRTAGGHIHVGLEKHLTVDEDVLRMVIKAMDLYLGVPSVLLDPDNRRRELYGKAGAYRVKPYGVEYRTLSNFWIHTDDLRKWAFRQTETAVANAASINLIVSTIGEQAIQDCINTGNKEMAEEILDFLGVYYERAA